MKSYRDFPTQETYGSDHSKIKKEEYSTKQWIAGIVTLVFGGFVMVIAVGLLNDLYQWILNLFL